MFVLMLFFAPAAAAFLALLVADGVRLVRQGATGYGLARIVLGVGTFAALTFVIVHAIRTDDMSGGAVLDVVALVAIAAYGVWVTNGVHRINGGAAPTKAQFVVAGLALVCLIASSDNLIIAGLWSAAALVLIYYCVQAGAHTRWQKRRAQVSTEA